MVLKVNKVQKTGTILKKKKRKQNKWAVKKKEWNRLAATSIEYHLLLMQNES